MNHRISSEEKLTDFGKAILKDRYLLPNESFDDMFYRVAKAYSNDDAHAERIFEYIAKMWFMPATPVLSNGGTNRGLPISCFLNECGDSITGITNLWHENVFLASRGGGIGSYWGNVRSIGEDTKNGKTSGIIPFIKVMDSMTLAISQGSLRRGSAAVYLPINHPEIKEFIDIRRPTGDYNRRSPNLHHGVCITDDFMRAVERDDSWNLVSPHDGKVMDTVKARHLWISILTSRLETGEPYILFIDNVNKNAPEIQKKLNLKIKTSNLCSEITLPTGIDHLGNERTAVCCLSSLNIETYDEWKGNKDFVFDVMYFLDNVLEDFINRAPKEMHRAVYAAQRERSVGLGVMGFHSYLQKNMIPFESVAAKSINKAVFSFINEATSEASKIIAKDRGACPDAQDAGLMERFSNKTAVAPTASISIITGGTSPCIEPFNTNIFTQKTLTGSFPVKNRYLIQLLEEKGMNTEDVWNEIISHDGSVYSLDFLTPEEKAVFKTSQEIDQMWIIDFAADRTPYIDQGSSTNLFIYADITKKKLHQIHYNAWKKGLKSLYYLRSMSVSRADKISADHDFVKETANFDFVTESENKYDECLACQ
jgi:ribonucleoside-diphosphate reductase alpha chain